MALARELLDVKLDSTPLAKTVLPRWLAPAVLRQWGRERKPHQRAMVMPLLLASGAGYRKVCREIYARWDNPVRATATLGGRFNNLPRLPYQLGEVAVRSAEVPRQLACLVRDRVKRLRSARHPFEPAKQA